MRQNAKNVSAMSNDGRNAYVIEHLTDACLKLLSDKTISDITISELCDTAGVGRASFYRNFESKEDIVKEYITQLFFEWGTEYGEGANRPLYELILSLFTHFEKHRGFYELLNKRNLIYLLKDAIIKTCDLNIESTALEAYTKAFAAYALYGWIEVWFQRGMMETAEEMANLFRMQER